MDIEEIKNMFSEMGLETPELRKQFNEELSIIMDNSHTDSIETIISNNTLPNID